MQTNAGLFTQRENSRLECAKEKIRISENYFDVRKSHEQDGRSDLIGSGCDCLIPANPPKEALKKRQQKANQTLRGDYIHTIPDSK